MNRRQLLGALLGAAAAQFDPDRQLWVPGKKLISIPAPLRFVPVNLVTLEVLDVLKGNLFHKDLRREMRVGDTIVLRSPRSLGPPHSKRTADCQ